MPVCRDLIFPPPPHKPPDRPIDTTTPAHQPPKIEDKPVDIDTIKPDLNMDLEENAPQQEGIINEVYERPRKEYLLESPELQAQVDSKNMVQRYFPKQVDLDKIQETFSKKGIKRHTFICHSEGDTGRIFKQPTLQRCILVFSSELLIIS